MPDILSQKLHPWNLEATGCVAYLQHRNQWRPARSFDDFGAESGAKHGPDVRLRVVIQVEGVLSQTPG